MSNKEYTPRNLANRGLSTDLPRANIVRIESLDGSSRQRYLASVQRAGDEIRKKLYENISQTGETVFYGFIQDGSKTTYNMNALWNASEASGAILGGLKKIGEKVNNAFGGFGGFGDAVVGGIGAANEVMGKITGTNSSSTGSGTVKEFSGVSLDDMTVTCAWYLPEQENLCKKSLKILYRMAYPKQLNTEALSETIPELAKDVGKEISRIGGDFMTAFGLGSEDEDKEIQSPTTDTASTNTSNAILEGAGSIMESFIQITEIFGSNYTFNPLPVRLSVGHHIDIEPLVITNVSTTFSPETFVDANGYHLPLFATTSIRFQYWLNPAPDLEFAKILNTSIYGVRADDNTEIKTSLKKNETKRLK